jgi:hypothetical protein
MLMTTASRHILRVGPSAANRHDGMDAAFYIAPVALKDEAETGKQFVAIAKDVSATK